MSTNLSKEEVARRRSEFTCDDYAPVPRHYRCQHFLKAGACALDGYVMCVEWLKANPKKAMKAPLNGATKPTPTHTGHNQGKPPRTRERRSHDKHLRVLKDQGPDPKLRDGDVFDLRAQGATTPDVTSHRPLIQKPELLTPEQVGQLAKLGYEVELKTEHSGTVVLVPEYTDRDRTEFSFEDCRTLVTILQVFPGARLERILGPSDKDKEKAS